MGRGIPSKLADTTKPGCAESATTFSTECQKLSKF